VAPAARNAAERVECGPVAFVYLLRCADDSLYCGWTVDVEKRLAKHEAGTASRYTASRRPVTLAASWELPTNTDARRMEARIKRLTRTQKLDLLVRFALPDS
jgi:putative endonuclease